MFGLCLGRCRAPNTLRFTTKYLSMIPGMQTAACLGLKLKVHVFRRYDHSGLNCKTHTYSSNIHTHVYAPCAFPWCLDRVDAEYIYTYIEVIYTAAVHMIMLFVKLRPMICASSTNHILVYILRGDVIRMIAASCTHTRAWLWRQPQLCCSM